MKWNLITHSKYLIYVNIKARLRKGWTKKISASYLGAQNYEGPLQSLS